MISSPHPRVASRTGPPSRPIASQPPSHLISSPPQSLTKCTSLNNHNSHHVTRLHELQNSRNRDCIFHPYRTPPQFHPLQPPRLLIRTEATDQNFPPTRQIQTDATTIPPRLKTRPQSAIRSPPNAICTEPTMTVKVKVKVVLAFRERRIVEIESKQER